MMERGGECQSVTQGGGGGEGLRVSGFRLTRQSPE